MNKDINILLQQGDSKGIREVLTTHPETIDALLTRGEQETNPEIQAIIAQSISFVPLNETQRNSARKILIKYYHLTKNTTVKIHALTSMVHVAKTDPFLTPTVKHLLAIASVGDNVELSECAKRLLPLM